MSLISLNFIFFAIVTVLLYQLWANSKYRELLLFAASALFIASYADNVVRLLPLLTFLLIGYVFIELVRLRKLGSLFVAAIVITLIVYIVLKQYSFVRNYIALPFSYLTIGLSYILFRILHIIIDTREGALSERISPLRYLNYTTNFLCFISGPIQKYQEYVTDLDRQNQRLDSNKIFSAFNRVTTGYFKICVLSGIANYFYSDQSTAILNPLSHFGYSSFALHYCASVIFFTVYLYMNFSGYMDVVIGLGWLLGRQLPENFNHPFRAAGFLEFWGRWHMTLSDWFKVYLFNPFLKFLVERFSAPALTPWLAVVVFFVTFLVMGIWHGTSVVFVIYGLTMGLGASVNKLWQLGIVAILGKKRYRRMCELPSYHYFCRGLTFAYFAIAVTCLWVNLSQLELILTRIGPLGALAVFAGLTVLSSITLYLLDAVGAIVTYANGRLAIVSNVVARNIAMASVIMIVFFVTSFFHKAPEFVYKAF
jgi:alginate O-acetyltransferase complex protein AlgI